MKNTILATLSLLIAGNVYAGPIMPSQPVVVEKSATLILQCEDGSRSLIGSLSKPQTFQSGVIKLTVSASESVGQLLEEKLLTQRGTLASIDKKRQYALDLTALDLSFAADSYTELKVGPIASEIVVTTQSEPRDFLEIFSGQTENTAYYTARISHGNGSSGFRWALRVLARIDASRVHLEMMNSKGQLVATETVENCKNVIELRSL